jgi:transposase-like protein
MGITKDDGPWQRRVFSEEFKQDAVRPWVDRGIAWRLFGSR